MGDSSSSASYIRMVHHLIEKCICFNLNKEQCMDALEKHANINPIITSTACKGPSHAVYHGVLSFHVIRTFLFLHEYIWAVWKELEKENKEFFETYNKDRTERNIEAETMQRIQKMLTEAAASKTSDDEEG
ncbi:unnamed protein product [Urochloa humidicola]